MHVKPVVQALLFSATLLAMQTPLHAQASLTQTPQQLQKTEGNDASAAASRGFAEFVQYQIQAHSGSLPEGFPLDVTDVQDLKDASIGYGFPVYTVDPKDLLAGRSDFSAMAKSTGTWRFIINRNQRPIGLVTVEKVNGTWQTVAYGAAGLSKDVDALTRFHGNADHSNLRFIRIYQARSDFLEVGSNNGATARFAPLQSARETLLLQQRANKAGNASDAATSGLLDASQFVEPLRAAVKANIANFR
ncbi:hypothetical protein LT85_2624 [Collimonas arenae]|uniref:Uncharacterized protein n=1 Tax=Collimonas arenae TaxID=279058 RepID=A0A0A1FG35_9BURK|nr:hypothetical protein [Collimonas arenae]AIY41782.1 hypothetical protein LT85_2624 [Collimonas arenae]